MRKPAPLLPAPAARLIGFALLAALGVAEWSRMIEAIGAGRALVWVAVAVVAGGLVWACERLPVRWQGWGMLGVAVVAVIAAVPAAGLPLHLLRPYRWDNLVDGLIRGIDSLAVVRLPYEGADPWPGHTLALLGALLCILAGLLAVWPRRSERGYPFLSVAALLVLATTPVVSLGGEQPLAFGYALAALTACFLWLERIPLRPGFGIAALLYIALAGAFPLAGAADRDEPWFDYRTFAEGLGPENPVRFSWDHEYGPINWPRDRREVLRIRSRRPEYWKAATLDGFEGNGWVGRLAAPIGEPVDEVDLPEDLRPNWTRRFDVSVRRLRTRDVISAGTTLSVDRPSRPVERSADGTGFEADTELRRGDSYSARAYVPRPDSEQLVGATSGAGGRQAGTLTINVPFRDDVVPGELPPEAVDVRRGVARGAEIRFQPFDTGDPPTAFYDDLGTGGGGAQALRASTYARTWEIAQQLREDVESPYGYVVAVDRYLHRPEFKYSERPPQPPPGAAPLETFLLDTHSGYCQHYSGAMALLLRMGGVPARVATGFSPGGFSSRRGEWIIRDSDAHSWVEAWFDDIGWVTFDPTPSATPARSQIAALPEASRSESAADAQADENIPDFPGRVDAPRGNRAIDPATGAEADDASADGGGGAGRGPAWPALAIGLAAAGGAAVVTRRRRRGPRGRDATSLDRAIAELEAAFSRAGRPTAPGTTLRQIEGLVGGSEEAVAYVRSLRAARYAAAPVRPTAAQRRALRRELAFGRRFTGRLRALWALPPRRV